MRVDDRFDDLVTSLGGFYRTWYVYVGLELGLFQRLRDAGSSGLTADELAQRTGTEPRLVHDWSWGADAHDLVAIDAGRITMPEDIAVELLLSPAVRELAAGRRAAYQFKYSGERGDGGEYRFVLDLAPELCGKLEYRIRAYPNHPALSHRFELGLMRWV